MLLRLAPDPFELRRQAFACRRFGGRARFGDRGFALCDGLVLDSLHLGGAPLRGLGLHACNPAVALGLDFGRVDFRRQQPVRFLADPANFVGQLLFRLAPDAFELRRQAFACRRFRRGACFRDRGFTLRHSLALDAFELGGALLRALRLDARDFAGAALRRLGFYARQLERLVPGRLRLQAVDLVLQPELDLCLDQRDFRRAQVVLRVVGVVRAGCRRPVDVFGRVVERNRVPLGVARAPDHGGDRANTRVLGGRQADAKLLGERLGRLRVGESGKVYGANLAAVARERPEVRDEPGALVLGHVAAKQDDVGDALVDGDNRGMRGRHELQLGAKLRADD